MEQQVNWDVVFNAGRNKFLNDLSNHKIDPSLASQYGAPLMNALYGLKPYILSDAAKSGNISANTKQYINKAIIPSMHKTIDDYWKNLGYIKKTTFKMMSKGNESRITGTIGSALSSLIYGMNAGLSATGSKNSNLFGVIDDLETYMGGSGSPLAVSALHKIQSLT